MFDISLAIMQIRFITICKFHVVVNITITTFDVLGQVGKYSADLLHTESPQINISYCGCVCIVCI